MNPNKAESHTYHLINLEGQEFFPGAVDVHQALRMNKSLLLNAISSQSTQQFGPAYETPAAEPLRVSYSVEELQELPTTLEIESVANDIVPSEFASSSGLQPVDEVVEVVPVTTQALPVVTDAAPVTAEAVPFTAEASEHSPEEPVVAGLPKADSTERPLQESFNVALVAMLKSALPAAQGEDEFERLISGTVGHETEYLLQDVQDTLGSLTGMASRLAEQKKDTLKQQKTTTPEAETNARAVAERSSVLAQLAESLEARERASTRRAELLQQENTRTEELSALLSAGLAQLRKRKGELQRKGLELSENLKQLKSTKERFSAIVKSFNESVQLGVEPQVIRLRADEDGGSRHVEPV
ncbi:hypothetical protein [Pseudomonas sp. HLT2-19-2]